LKSISRKGMLKNKRKKKAKNYPVQEMLLKCKLLCHWKIDPT